MYEGLLGAHRPVKILNGPNSLCFIVDGRKQYGVHRCKYTTAKKKGARGRQREHQGSKLICHLTRDSWPVRDSRRPLCCPAGWSPMLSPFHPQSAHVVTHLSGLRARIHKFDGTAGPMRPAATVGWPTGPLILGHFPATSWRCSPTPGAHA